MKILKILVRLRKGEDIEKVFKNEKWQTFEEFVAWIFEQHGFETKIHFRFKRKVYREIDILAVRGDITIAVECKKWKGKSCVPSKIKKVSEIHKEKCKSFSHFLNKKVIPVVVTLLDTGIFEEDSIIFVPIFKLNNFRQK